MTNNNNNKTPESRLAEIRNHLVGLTSYWQGDLDKVNCTSWHTGEYAEASDDEYEYWYNIEIVNDVLDGWDEPAKVRVTWRVRKGDEPDVGTVSDVEWEPSCEGVKMADESEEG